MSSPKEIAESLGRTHRLVLSGARWGVCRFEQRCPQCKRALVIGETIGLLAGDIGWKCEPCTADLMLCGPRPKTGHATYLTAADMAEHQRRVRAARADLGRAVSAELENL